MQSEAKTQKSRGLIALRSSGSWGNNVPNFEIISNYTELTQFLKMRPICRNVSYPIFARPCPITPRHGFVESKIVANSQQLKSLWTKAIKADPKAEMILMKPVDCKASAIITENKISIGPDNDGATSGRNTLNLPLSGLMVVSEYTAAEAGIKTSPYIEALFPKHGDQLAVQLRDGPTCKTSGNQIPKTTKVKKIVTPETYPDLLQWEKVMEKATAGTVVFHPGGSPLSHYSVHAILNNIPVVFDKSPKIGSILKSNSKNKPTFPDEVCLGIRDGLSAALGIEQCSTVLNFAVMGAHHALSMMYDKEGSYLVGLSAALMVKLAYAACLGENRYFTGRQSERETIYRRILTNFGQNRQDMLEAYNNFKPDRTYDIGGGKWKTCARTAIRLENYLIQYSTKPDTKVLKRVIKTMHNLINCTHNNGYLFDKFDGYEHECDKIFANHAEGNPQAVLEAANEYYEWKKTFTVKKFVNPSKMKPVVTI